MNLYYNLYICSECGREAHLEDGAVYCPFCGRALYRARSGAKKTVRACRTMAKIMAGISLPSLMAAIVVGSTGLFWFAVAALTVAAAALANAHEEARKTVKCERRKV